MLKETHYFRFVVSKMVYIFRKILVHLVNQLSNILSDDPISCYLRKVLLTFLGIKFGLLTSIKGGSYFAGGGLTTQEKCYINRNCYFDFTGKINFGSNVVVGHGVSFITAHHEIGNISCRAGKVKGLSIVVGDGVWIGANATILPGITIDKGAIIAAGAVVTKNVNSHTIVAGVPAKVIKELEKSVSSSIVQ